MRVLVTGGAGFIGSNLVEFLCKEGNEVTVLDNFSTGDEENLKGLPVNIISGDVRDPQAVEDAMEGKDYVFHLAAIASVVRSIENPEETFDVNIKGTLNVLRSAVKNKVRKIVFSSSCAIYGNSLALPKTENMLLAPLSPYAVTKATSEHLFETFYEIYKLPYTNLRYFNVFGPKQNSSSPYSGVIAIFIEKALKNEPIFVYGDGLTTRDFVFVEDVVKANWQAATNDVIGTFNIGTGKRVTIKEIAEKIIGLTKSSSEIIHREERAGDIKHSLCSIEKARQHLGWEPSIDFEIGLKKTIEFISNP